MWKDVPIKYGLNYPTFLTVLLSGLNLLTLADKARTLRIIKMSELGLYDFRIFWILIYCLELYGYNPFCQYRHRFGEPATGA